MTTGTPTRYDHRLSPSQLINRMSLLVNVSDLLKQLKIGDPNGGDKAVPTILSHQINVRIAARDLHGQLEKGHPDSTGEL